MQEHLQLKQPIISALTSSFQADQEKLKAATTYLAEICKTPGYCMTLMQIVDDANTNQNTKQAALIQLKNTIKRHWKAKSFQIQPKQKQQIKEILVLAMVRCSKSYKLIKLYKEIITIIVGHQYKTWLPVDTIVAKIKADEDLIAMVQVLIAIATSFEFSITQEERSYFFEFLQKIMPDLNALRQRNTNAQLIYLITKFLWKAVHYQINDQTKKLTVDWMDLIAMIVNLSNPEYDNNIDQLQNKGTPQFYYFHTKKWATRILLRFIQKHAKATFIKKNEKNKQFSQYWYANFGQKFVEILIHQFSVPSIKKVRYFQLKCIQTLINQKPNEIKHFAKVFQEEILLRFMTLKPQDEQMAQADPIQFLNKQMEPSISFTNLKRVATDVWVSFAQLGCQAQKKNSPYKPGVFFYDNMKYLKQRLQASNLIQKQMAMYLICQLRSPIMKCKQIKDQLPKWIDSYIIPQFANQVMFLRARAVDIFYEYGSIQNLPYAVIQQATQGIYKCLTNDHYPLVRIKAANAFNCILRHKNAKELVQPLLQNILQIYLQLLEKYDLESLVNSLESIVEGFSNQIGPYAAELGKYLAKLFIKMFQKDVEQCANDDYDGQAELAAAGCLKTFTQIVDAPITQESIVALEPQVISLCEFIFSAETIDYIEDILVLLNSYLHKIQNISPAIWFYYQVIVYNIVGVPKPLWEHIPNLPISDKQKAILNNIKNAQNIEMMQQSMPVLRNYIRKGSNVIINNQDAFKTNLLQLLFYLVNQVYKKGPNQFTGQIQMTCATALLIYLLQNNKGNLPEPIYIVILAIVKFNIVKAKSKTLKVLNSQLQALLLWINPTLVMMFIQKQKIAEQFMKELLVYEPKYQEQHQRQRMILGLSTLMKHPEKPEFLLVRFPDMFKTLMKLVKKNAQDRIQEVNIQQGKKHQQDFDEDYDQDLQNHDDIDFDDDDQEFWEQQYGDNYLSPLMTLDEIQYFEQSIKQIESEQNVFYNQMIKIVSQEELGQLSQIVEKAKNYLYAKKTEGNKQ